MSDPNSQLLSSYNPYQSQYGGVNANQSVVPKAKIGANGLQYTNPNQSLAGQQPIMANTPGGGADAPINLFASDTPGVNPSGINGGGFSTAQKWFGGTNAAGASTMGYMNGGLGVANFGLNAYMGMKNYGLAKDQLAAQKEAFKFNKDTTMLQLENTARTTNAELADRQRIRNAGNPNSMPVAEYMAQYGVSGGGN